MKIKKTTLTSLFAKQKNLFSVKLLYLLLSFVLLTGSWYQYQHQNCLLAYRDFFQEKAFYIDPGPQKTTDLSSLSLTPLALNEEKLIQLHQTLFSLASFSLPSEPLFKDLLKESVLSSDIKKQFLELSQPHALCLSSGQIQELLPQLSNNLKWKERDCSLSFLNFERVSSPHFDNFYNFQIKLLSYQGFSHE